MTKKGLLPVEEPFFRSRWSTWRGLSYQKLVVRRIPWTV